MNSQREAPDRIWLEYTPDEQHLHLTDELVWTGYLTEYVKAETVRQAATEQGVGEAAYICHKCENKIPPPEPFKAYCWCEACEVMTAATIAAELGKANPPRPTGGGVPDGLLQLTESLATALYAAVHAGKLNEADKIKSDDGVVEIAELLDWANDILAIKQQPEHQASFQSRVNPWLIECFGEQVARDQVERNHRFLEEALELVQATGCTEAEANELVSYVYGRDIGDPPQEVGGVMVTLAALCLAHSMNMHEAGEVELARIWTKVPQIREKQKTKPAMSALPGVYPGRQPPEQEGSS